MVTVIGSEVETVSVIVGVVGVEEGPEAPISLVGAVVGEAPIAPVSLAGELFEGAPIAPISLVGDFLGGASIAPVNLAGKIFGGASMAPVSLWYIFKDPKASEEVGWNGEALGFRLSVEEGEFSVVGLEVVEVG